MHKISFFCLVHPLRSPSLSSHFLEFISILEVTYVAWRPKEDLGHWWLWLCWTFRVQYVSCCLWMCWAIMYSALLAGGWIGRSVGGDICPGGSEWQISFAPPVDHIFLTQVFLPFSLPKVTHHFTLGAGINELFYYIFESLEWLLNLNTKYLGIYSLVCVCFMLCCLGWG